MVARAGNARFLRLVERAIPRLAAQTLHIERVRIPLGPPFRHTPPPPTLKPPPLRRSVLNSSLWDFAGIPACTASACDRSRHFRIAPRYFLKRARPAES